MARKLAAGNWKMNGVAADLAQISALMATHPAPRSTVLICPPATLLQRMADVVAGRFAVGGQDCHAMDKGAHTGDISAVMLADAGAGYVILGHSERRADHGETDAQIARKALAALAAGLVPVICVGETEAQRDSGKTLDVVAQQLAGSVPADATADRLVIAYEPVWAIGTGRTPTLQQITEVHAHLRARLMKQFGPQASDIPIIYGGSVKPDNAAQIFGLSDVDGALVGGASLKASDFGAIIDALDAS
ncbi:MAG: triose-phosphate isomerase [Gemmobacter sp.]|nr:triose-phosphate isomerase [Gemmobacter sp.]